MRVQQNVEATDELECENASSPWAVRSREGERGNHRLRISPHLVTEADMRCSARVVWGK